MQPLCLANGRGGVLLIGIEDDGTAAGARPRLEAGRTDPFRVQALIENMTQPPASAVVSLVELAGQNVLVAEVPDSPRVVGTTQGTRDSATSLCEAVVRVFAAADEVPGVSAGGGRDPGGTMEVLTVAGMR